MICIMVGVPARGKTTMARKLCKYWNWLGYECKVFNIGEHRKAEYENCSPAGFFDHTNPEAVAIRNKLAETTLEALMEWVMNKSRRDVLDSEKNPIAIYDGANVTRERRSWILSRLLAQGFPLKELVFIELVCNDHRLVISHLNMSKLRANNYALDTAADYLRALKDFRQRIEYYERAYQTIEKDEWAEVLGIKETFFETPWKRPDLMVNVIKIIDKTEISVWGCRELLPNKTAQYLINLNLDPKTLYLCRCDTDANIDSGISSEWLQQICSVDFTYPLAVAVNNCIIGSLNHREHCRTSLKSILDHHLRDQGVNRFESLILEVERSNNILVIGNEKSIQAIFEYFEGSKTEIRPWSLIKIMSQGSEFKSVLHGFK